MIPYDVGREDSSKGITDHHLIKATDKGKITVRSTYKEQKAIGLHRAIKQAFKMLEHEALSFGDKVQYRLQCWVV